jgi:hypothetical protein
MIFVIFVWTVARDAHHTIYGNGNETWKQYIFVSTDKLGHQERNLTNLCQKLSYVLNYKIRCTFFKLCPIFVGPTLCQFIKYSYRHSSIYTGNVGTHKKQGKQKLRKSRLLSSTNGEENRIGIIINRVKSKIAEIVIVEIEEHACTFFIAAHSIYWRNQANFVAE